MKSFQTSTADVFAHFNQKFDMYVLTSAPSGYRGILRDRHPPGSLVCAWARRCQRSRIVNDNVLYHSLFLSP
jgi:hypothetical protein